MLATFLILFNTLLFKYFSLNVYFEGIRILPINSIIWRHDFVILRHCVNQAIPKVGNDKYIFLCNFGGHSMSGFEVIAGGLWSPSNVAGSEKKKPGLNRDKYTVFIHNCTLQASFMHGSWRQLQSDFIRVTVILLWKVLSQESFHKHLEHDRPRERRPE